jgi:hypothetical protein
MALTDFTGINSVRGALLCSALATPSLVPMAAFAQDQDNACVQLQSAGDQIDFTASGISQDQFAQVVQGNDPQQCQVLLTQISDATGAEGQVSETEQARVRLEDEVVIEGRAIIDQDRPSVQVEEQPVEVIVGSTSPDVNVAQGQIDILIRQGAPLVTFEMPQPTITIQQPAPEIIVTMPDPSVDVANARPQIEVRQGEPRIQVTMAEPTVELELYQATDPENSPGIEIARRDGEAGAAAMEPEIATSRAEAQITYQDAEDQQANVTVSREDPMIRFEQGEPQVEITTTGEPQISWTQTGEPVVRYEESGAGAQQDAGLDQQDPQPEMTAETAADPAQDEDAQASAMPDPDAKDMRLSPSRRLRQPILKAHPFLACRATRSPKSARS